MSALPVLPDGQSLMVEEVMTRVGIIEGELPGFPPSPPGNIYLSLFEWTALMREIREKGPHLPNEFFTHSARVGLQIGRVRVCNTGTDDADVVAMCNEPYYRLTRFADRKRRLQSGRVAGM